MRRGFLMVAFLFPLLLSAQRFITEQSTVIFFSEATIENITAQNVKAKGLYDVSSGEIAFSIPIRDFVFEKALMQEHFNEKYMETEKFPKATFQGKVSGYAHGTAALQTVHALGKLTIHGVTRDVDIIGTIETEGGKLLMKSKFAVVLADYAVPRPQILWQNIAEQVEVSISFTFKPYEK